MSARRLVVASVLAGSLGVAGEARADIHKWIACGMGAFKSCHSVALTTTAIMSGSVRVGTNLNIELTNLQGTGLYGENSPWASLFQVIFYGIPGPPINGFQTYNMLPTLNGGASGGGTGFYSQWEAYFPQGNQINLHSNYQFLDGCAYSGQSYPGPLQTCGAGQSISFNFNSSFIVDASQYTGIYLGGLAPGATSPFGFQDYMACETQPGGVNFGPGYPATPQCSVEFDSAVNVVPEPVTMVLLGSGLLGVGGVRMRRKKKEEPEA